MWPLMVIGRLQQCVGASPWTSFCRQGTKEVKAESDAPRAAVCKRGYRQLLRHVEPQLAAKDGSSSTVALFREGNLHSLPVSDYGVQHEVVESSSTQPP